MTLATLGMTITRSGLGAIVRRVFWYGLALLVVFAISLAATLWAFAHQSNIVCGSLPADTCQIASQEQIMRLWSLANDGTTGGLTTSATVFFTLCLLLIGPLMALRFFRDIGGVRTKGEIKSLVGRLYRRRRPSRHNLENVEGAERDDKLKNLKDKSVAYVKGAKSIKTSVFVSWLYLFGLVVVMPMLVLAAAVLGYEAFFNLKAPLSENGHEANGGALILFVLDQAARGVVFDIVETLDWPTSPVVFTRAFDPLTILLITFRLVLSSFAPGIILFGVNLARAWRSKEILDAVRDRLMDHVGETNGLDPEEKQEIVDAIELVANDQGGQAWRSRSIHHENIAVT